MTAKEMIDELAKIEPEALVVRRFNIGYETVTIVRKKATIHKSRSLLEEGCGDGETIGIAVIEVALAN